MGCVEVGNCLILTKRGKDIIDLDFKDRIYFLAKIVFSEPIMNDVLNDKIPSKDSFKKYNVNSQSTVERRLRTVRSWIGYFKKVLQYSKWKEELMVKDIDKILVLLNSFEDVELVLKRCIDHKRVIWETKV